MVSERRCYLTSVEYGCTHLLVSLDHFILLEIPDKRSVT